jgi:hypothetical protein
MPTRIIAPALILAGLVWMPPGTTAPAAGLAECVRPSGVQRIVFRAEKFPNVRRHFLGALRRGWPRRLVVNRRGADAQRERALRDIPTREASTETSTPRRSAAGAGRGSSVAATRAAGRPTCATCRALRTDHTARRLETGSNPSATAPAFATCSADSVSCRPTRGDRRKDLRGPGRGDHRMRHPAPRHPDSARLLSARAHRDRPSRRRARAGTSAARER